MRCPTTLKIVFLAILLFSIHGTGCSRLRTRRADAEKLRGDAFDIGSTREFLAMDKQNGPPLTPFSHRSAPHMSTPLTAAPSYERTGSNVSHVLPFAPIFTDSPLPGFARNQKHGISDEQKSYGDVGKESNLFFSRCRYDCERISRDRCWTVRRNRRKRSECKFIGYKWAPTCCFYRHRYRTLRPRGPIRLRRWRRGVRKLSRRAGC